MDSGYNKFMMLKIKNITKDDFGFYKCIAKNSLGETDGIIKLDGNFSTLVDWFKAASDGGSDWKRWKNRKNNQPFLRSLGIRKCGKITQNCLSIIDKAFGVEFSKKYRSTHCLCVYFVLGGNWLIPEFTFSKAVYLWVYN